MISHRVMGDTSFQNEGYAILVRLEIGVACQPTWKRSIVELHLGVEYAVDRKNVWDAWQHQNDYVSLLAAPAFLAQSMTLRNSI